MGTVNLTDANLSRSLYAYMNNPAEERALYDSSVDQTLTMLRFQRASDGLNVGVLTWFPVHGTSMYVSTTAMYALTAQPVIFALGSLLSETFTRGAHCFIIY